MSKERKFGFVVEYVADIEASKRFYIEVIGLDVKREHPTYVQFETFAIASDEPMASESRTEIYWTVDDVEAAFNELSKKTEIGLPITQKPFGKVFAVKNPDGRLHYILEFAKQRPSRLA